MNVVIGLSALAVGSLFAQRCVLNKCCPHSVPLSNIHNYAHVGEARNVTGVTLVSYNKESPRNPNEKHYENLQTAMAENKDDVSRKIYIVTFSRVKLAETTKNAHWYKSHQECVDDAKKKIINN